MRANNKRRTQKNWMMATLFIVLICIFFVFEETTAPPDVSASIHISGSAAFSAPPNMHEVTKRVLVAKNVSYHDSPNSFLDIYYPKDAVDSMPVILWIHGGGYVGGSKESRQDYAMSLADAGYVVANIDYSLAPKALYPGPIVQANEALAYMKIHAKKYGGDMDRIFIGGDSAGAQIASQVTALVSNAALAKTMAIQPSISSDQLRGAVLLCGIYNMNTLRATAFPNIDRYLTAYTGAEPFESFAKIDELSTVQHINSDFPPVFITVGDADPFVSQSTELVDVLQSYEVQVASVFFEGTHKNLKHEYQYDLYTDDARETFQNTLDFLAVKSK